MNTDRAIKGIVTYCNEQIDDFKERADLAVFKSWRERIPVEVADYSLADEVRDAIDEWCTDHDCPTLVDDISVEDILFNM